MIDKKNLILIGEMLAIAGIGLLIYGDWLNRVWNMQIETSVQAGVPIMIDPYPPGSIWLILGGAALIIGVSLCAYGFITRRKNSKITPVSQI